MAAEVRQEFITCALCKKSQKKPTKCFCDKRIKELIINMTTIPVREFSWVGLPINIQQQQLGWVGLMEEGEHPHTTTANPCLAFTESFSEISYSCQNCARLELLKQNSLGATSGDRTQALKSVKTMDLLRVMSVIDICSCNINLDAQKMVCEEMNIKMWVWDRKFLNIIKLNSSYLKMDSIFWITI